MSPVRPPTPQDKSITPDEWLRTGEDENKKRSSIPSLDEVKKQLLCYAMDLELNTSSSKQQGTNYVIISHLFTHNFMVCRQEINFWHVMYIRKLI